MADNREMFSARVLPVVRRIITAEARTRDISEGQLIDELALMHCRGAEAVKLVLEYAAKHPLVKAFLEIEKKPSK